MPSFHYPVNGGGASAYWGDSVANSGSLPVSGAVVGEVVFVRDTEDFYYWNGSAWVKVLWSLTNDVTGVLPVANGGTNSSTSLNNNRIMRSTTGAIVEAAAITAARALISDANGIPTHSVTTATELGYVSGVASAIQTQLDNEVTARSAADVTLQNNIDAEESARIAADGVLQDNIDTEEARALAAEAALQSDIDDVAADLVTHESDTTTHGTVGNIVGTSDTQSLTNKTIDADLNTITNIENADIKAAAAIAVNKLAALTASRAVVTDGSGFISAATTTATEIGHVNGVTSAIQTQLDGKQANIITTKADLIVGNASNVAARLGVGTDGDVLTADSAQTLGVKWATPGTARNKIVTTITTGDITSTTSAIMTVSGLTTGRYYQVLYGGKVDLQAAGVSRAVLAIVHNSVTRSECRFDRGGGEAITLQHGNSTEFIAAASTVTMNVTVTNSTLKGSTSGALDGTFMIVEELNNTDVTNANTTTGSF